MWKRRVKECLGLLKWSIIWYGSSFSNWKYMFCFVPDFVNLSETPEGLVTLGSNYYQSWLHSEDAWKCFPFLNWAYNLKILFHIQLAHYLHILRQEWHFSLQASAQPLQLPSKINFTTPIEILLSEKPSVMNPGPHEKLTSTSAWRKDNAVSARAFFFYEINHTSQA